MPSSNLLTASVMQLNLCPNVPAELSPCYRCSWLHFSYIRTAVTTVPNSTDLFPFPAFTINSELECIWFKINFRLQDKFIYEVYKNSIAFNKAMPSYQCFIWYLSILVFPS